jgi:hypothetical protein
MNLRQDAVTTGDIYKSTFEVFMLPWSLEVVNITFTGRLDVIASVVIYQCHINCFISRPSED